ncbi:hypothetical protein MAR_015960 [Mya arenaria]|uniref:Uncharacterized protein n=1 Tax=Mya arenaria TaxID=6604 RepID=A0ABY7FS05_MYAAR|nr:hypothetical protein MAR_015960 [Mya arenaria]
MPGPSSVAMATTPCRHRQRLVPISGTMSSSDTGSNVRIYNEGIQDDEISAHIALVSLERPVIKAYGSLYFRMEDSVDAASLSNSGRLAPHTATREGGIFTSLNCYNERGSTHGACAIRMWLNSLWVLGLSKNLKEIIVGQEVEPREDLALRLQFSAVSGQFLEDGHTLRLHCVRLKLRKLSALPAVPMPLPFFVQRPDCLDQLQVLGITRSAEVVGQVLGVTLHPGADHRLDLLCLLITSYQLMDRLNTNRKMRCMKISSSSTPASTVVIVSNADEITFCIITSRSLTPARNLMIKS